MKNCMAEVYYLSSHMYIIFTGFDYHMLSFINICEAWKREVVLQFSNQKRFG